MAENGGEESESSQTKPCLTCRRRKIKCDKVRPCSNCMRSRQLCTYENLGVGSNASSEVHRGIASDANILERLVKLESVVATLLRSNEERPGRGGVPNSEQLPDGSFSLGPPGLPQREDSLVNDTGYPVGQQIYQEGYSAYFDSHFWPGLITEVHSPEIMISMCIYQCFIRSKTFGAYFRLPRLPTMSQS
jgi:Fungal Zn(2)-Cys(6) binuclear cluster domain